MRVDREIDGARPLGRAFPLLGHKMILVTHWIILAATGQPSHSVCNGPMGGGGFFYRAHGTFCKRYRKEHGRFTISAPR